MKRAVIVIVISVLLFSFDVCLSQPPSQKPEEWTWKDGHGKTRTKAELQAIILNHKKWLGTVVFSNNGVCIENGRRSWSKASAKLGSAEILGIHGFSPLSGADLRCANLIGINLSGSQVFGTDLRGAVLSHAKLKKTIWVGSALRGAILNQADLQGAVFSAVPPGEPSADVDLTEIQFQSANLSDAILFNVDLSNAQLWESDLRNVKFEPRTIPVLRSISTAKNLETMTYTRNPDALTQLRNEFKIMGFRDQERKLTYALKRRDAELLKERCVQEHSFSGILSCVEWGVITALFDWTVRYGMNPGRVFMSVLFLLLSCAAFYRYFMRSNTNPGLFIVVPVNKPDNRPKWIRGYLLQHIDSQGLSGMTTSHEFPIQSKAAPSVYAKLKREMSLWWLALVFSLMSTFNIKFRDVDFGRWLRLLTTEEYDIKVKGRARTVSGIQALISVYLVFLGITSYWFRPFE